MKIYVRRQHSLSTYSQSEAHHKPDADTIQVQLGKPVSFIRVTDWGIDEVLLSGVETTQRQRHRQSPPQHT